MGYYSSNVIKNLIKSLKKKPSSLMTMHKFNDKLVIKRPNIITDNIYDITDLTRQHVTELHTVAEKDTDVAWVDIDPGTKADPKEVIKLTKDLYLYLKNQYPSEELSIYYSGGKGFYIRIFLDNKRDIDELRHELEQKLTQFISYSKNREILTLGIKTLPNQIRLDLSTLHDKGSIRAPYSLNTTTNRVSIPLAFSELDNFDMHKMTPDYVTQKIGDISDRPELSEGSQILQGVELNKEISIVFVIQEHKAIKAGRHYDLRLVDQAKGIGYSWVVPKGYTPPVGGEKLLAIKMPNHDINYSLYLQGSGLEKLGPNKIRIPDGRYGAGEVEIIKKVNMTMKYVEKEINFWNSIEHYKLSRMYFNKWLWMRLK